MSRRRNRSLVLPYSLVVALLLILVLGGGALLRVQLAVSNLMTEAVEKGHAVECPPSGAFAWKGECETAADTTTSP